MNSYVGRTEDFLKALIEPFQNISWIRIKNWILNKPEFLYSYIVEDYVWEEYTTHPIINQYYRRYIQAIRHEAGFEDIPAEWILEAFPAPSILYVVYNRHLPSKPVEEYYATSEKPDWNMREYHPERYATLEKLSLY